jgi:hypothetical protein
MLTLLNAVEIMCSTRKALHAQEALERESSATLTEAQDGLRLALQQVSSENARYKGLLQVTPCAYVEPASYPDAPYPLRLMKNAVSSKRTRRGYERSGSVKLVYHGC